MRSMYRKNIRRMAKGLVSRVALACASYAAFAQSPPKVLGQHSHASRGPL
jgi:hypothetical protein